jgi:hypothetical protein
LHGTQLAASSATLLGQWLLTVQMLAIDQQLGLASIEMPVLDARLHVG